VLVDGNASTVIGDATTSVLGECDINMGAVPGHRLVHGVIDDLPNQVVKPRRTG
jgi:hypothetical protein